MPARFVAGHDLAAFSVIDSHSTSDFVCEPETISAAMTNEIRGSSFVIWSVLSHKEA